MRNIDFSLRYVLPGRFILIGERFFHNYQFLEIIGDVYECTEAFCHYSRNSPEPKISRSFTIPIFGEKKSGKYGRLKNCPKQMSKNRGKSSPIRMTLSCFRAIKSSQRGLQVGTLFPARASHSSPLSTLPGIATAVHTSCLGVACCFSNLINYCSNVNY